MIKTEVGPRVYLRTAAAATASYSPPNDRGAIVRRIVVDNVSANDNWTVTVSGRELMRFRVLTTGSQRLLFIPAASGAYRPNFFDWCRAALGKDPSIPVPLGMTLTVASVGGATADILIESEEHDAADVNNPGMVNHYRGTSFLIPIYWFLNASQTAAGLVQFDTQVAPAWVPDLKSGAAIPVNWRVELLALFHEGAGVNTFSGAANHQSFTQFIQWLRDQGIIWTRNNEGIPNEGSASAAGSANTVFGQRSAMFPPFEFSNDNDDNILNPSIVLGGGESLQQLLSISGDLTGGAAYSLALQVAIAQITTPGFGGGS